MADSEPTQHMGPEEGSLKGPGGFVALVLVGVVGLMLWQWLAPVKSAVDWQADLPAALDTAKTSGKKVLISFTSTGCIYCRKMEANVLPQEEVLAEIEKFIPVQVDVNRNVELADKYRVQALPGYVVVDHRGREIGMIDGYVPAGMFVRFLQAAAAAN